jgi:hypothetical protein
MAYLVSITVRAERDFASLYYEIDVQHSATCLKWYMGLKDAILSLEELPYRCPVISKKGQLRHLVFSRRPDVYRVVYRGREKKKQVEEPHIRHGARGKISAADLR